jgi:shikimate kinase
MDKNIVLTGMRGSGKTTIGKELAALMNRKFIDLDQEIEKHAEMPISKIVETHDWDHFRKLEKEVNKKVAQLSGVVIATGGGTIIDEENEKSLRENGFVVFLKCPIEILAERIKNSENRPSLTGKSAVEELEEVWQERKQRYEESADLIFNGEETEELFNLLP